MPIQVIWEPTQQPILRYIFTGQWTWKEYFPVVAKGRELMKSKAGYVGILNDWLDTGYVPSDFLAKAMDVIDTRPTNTGLVIFLNQTLYFQSLYNTFARIHPDVKTHYVLVTTEDEALTQLTTWLDSAGNPSTDS